MARLLSRLALVVHTYQVYRRSGADAVIQSDLRVWGLRLVSLAMRPSRDRSNPRVEKKVGSVYTEYVYGAYGELFNLHDRTTWTAHIIPMGATPLAVYQDGTTRFFHANGLGSTTFLTDHAGATTQKTLFYPWGQRWLVGGTLKDERFASLGQRDAETKTWQDQLDPTLFRLYTSVLGRWMSPDPPGGNIFNPQSLNRYAYVLNNH